MRQMNPDKKVILAGPGRWGTTSVSLGIPVTFAEISRAACVCEIVEMRDDLVPDVSLGTHFFNDLVEFDILYLALYPHKEGTVLDREYLRAAENKIRAYLPDGDRMEDVIRVLEGGSEPLVLHADSLNQRYVIGGIGITKHEKNIRALRSPFPDHRYFLKTRICRIHN